MSNIEIVNLTNEEIEEIDMLDDLTKYMSEYMKVKDAVFNIIFVDNKKIREINKTYRNIDRQTDVISFALEDDKTFNTDAFRFLGDIYISIDKAKEQAIEYGHSLKREIAYMVFYIC